VGTNTAQRSCESPHVVRRICFGFGVRRHARLAQGASSPAQSYLGTNTTTFVAHCESAARSASTALSGELRVASAVIQQRLTFAHCASLDLGDEDRMIACFVVVHELTLQVRQRVVE